MPHDSNRLTKALGEAVVRLWSDLPAAAQHGLFEAAVACEGETIRTDLALFLHYKHQRTADSPGKAQEVPEPDSLGG